MPNRRCFNKGAHVGRHAANSIVSGKRKPLAHIDNVAPSAHARAYSNVGREPEKVGKGSFAKEAMRRRTRKKALIVLLCVVLALCAAIGTGTYMYFKTTDKNLGFEASNAADALVAAADGEPYYVLCMADLSVSGKLPLSEDDLAVMLVRIDENAKSLTFASFPAKLQIPFSDGKSYAIGAFPEELGDAGLISAIADFTGVSISHFITTDAEHLGAAVGKLGSIEIDVPLEVDDPHAGHVVIDAGSQSLDSEAAMVFLRATNVSGGFSGTASNRVSFTMRLLSEALGGSGIGLASAVSDVSEYIQTDWSASGLISAGEALQPIDGLTVHQCSVPCTETTSVSDWSKLLSCNSAEWAIMCEAIRSGEDPSSSAISADAVALRDCSVEIRNGASINGAGATLSSKLESLGYTIGDVGNTTDGVVYPDTLVIYTNPDNETSASMVLGDISCGRLVNGGDFYTTSSDVLVIIGADWVS